MPKATRKPVSEQTTIGSTAPIFTAIGIVCNRLYTQHKHRID